MTTKYQCQTCNGKAAGYKSIASHLEKVHGIDMKTDPCKQRETSHVDYADIYISTFECIYDNGVVVITEETRKRSKEDVFLWGSEEE